jgi:hypothetical protein
VILSHSPPFVPIFATEDFYASRRVLFVNLALACSF